MISHAPLAVEAPLVNPRLRAVTNLRGYDYLLSLPDNYTANGEQPWPLFLFLHGSAQRGINVWEVAQQGAPKLLVETTDLSPAEKSAGTELAKSFIVVAPQCPPYEVWDDAALLVLLDDLGRELNLDPARVYLTGLSMGGFGVWSLGMRYPQRFASIVPICGGGRVADIVAAASTRPSALQSLGVWAFHGAKDIVVPLAESERMIEALKSAGLRDVRFTVFPDADHNAWSPAYADRKLYAWLLSHSRQMD